MKTSDAITIVNFVQEAFSRRQSIGMTTYLDCKTIAKDLILEAIAKGYAEDSQRIAEIALYLNDIKEE
jgi:hypothetical protein